MTQTVSISDVKIKKAEKRRSPAVHYAKNLLFQNKKFIILCFAMHLLGAPFFLFYSIFDIMSEGSLDEGMYGMICILSLIIAIFSGVPIAMNCFRHLYDKQTVDMEISLPLTMKERFFAGYLSGLAAYVLPMIAAEVFALIELPIVRDLYIKRAINGDFAEEDLEGIDRLLPALCMLIFGGALLMTFFYSAYILTMCFCGQRNECGGYGLAANFCIPAIFLCFEMIVGKYGFGYELAFAEDSLFGILFWMTSPLGTGISLGMCVFEFMDNNAPLTFFSAASFGGYVVKALFMILITVGAAYFTYTKRRSEQTGKTFVFKGFYYFMTTVLCITIMVLFDSFGMDGGLFTAGVISAIIYIILDSMANRGIKRLGFSVIKFLMTFAASFAIIMIIRYTGVFGTMYSTPRPNEISEVHLSFNDPLSDEYEDLTLSGEEAIRLATEFQRASINSFKKTGMKKIDGDFNTSKYNVTLEYSYKNGIKERRVYPLFADTSHFTGEIVLLDETKDLKLDRLNKTVINSGLSFVIRESSTGKEVTVNLLDDHQAVSNALLDCYARDLRNLTPERYREGIPSFADRRYTIYSKNSATVLGINGLYPETIEYLSNFTDFNYLPPEYNEGDIMIAKAYGNGETSVRNLAASNELCEYLTFISDDESQFYNGYGRSANRTVYMDSLSPDEAELLYDIIYNSYSAYIPDGECYIIITGSLTAYIPERYYEDIERYFI